jgi:hypothetical protein
VLVESRFGAPSQPCVLLERLTILIRAFPEVGLVKRIRS